MTDTHLPLPTEVALGSKEHLDPQLSPDGTAVTYLAPLGGVSNVWHLELATGVRRPLTRSTQDPIGGMFSYVSALGRSVWHRWAYDGRHVLHLADRGGDEAFHVRAVDVETGASRDLTPYESVQATILGLSPEVPEVVAVQLGAEDPSRLDLHRITIADGTSEVTPNPGYAQWVLDRRLRPLGGIVTHDDGSSTLETLDGIELFRQPVTDGPLTAFGTDDEGRVVLLTSAGGTRARVLLLDSRTREVGEPFPADPVYDAKAPVPHPSTGAVDLLRIARERTVTDGLPPELRDLDPDGAVTVVSRSLDDQVWLLEIAHDDAPLEYVLWDRHVITPLFEHLPALHEHPLARQEPFTFTSSDGWEVHGYVVAPPHLERRDLPTVVLVHGGPAQRQLWGWGDPYVPFAQWFASRGYLVLLVDFRGSDGYGTPWLRAINREWGGRSLQDLLDAVDHAAALGWADPDRVAFWGASFGGYTSLAAAAFAPDRLRCAVPIAPISDLERMIASVPPYWKNLHRHWVEVLGNPETEADFLRERSPISRVDELDVPLLLVHGANDPRCRPEESQRIVEALERRGVPVEHLVLEDEGHVFTRPESWRRVLAATETFLAEHLAVR